MTRCGSGGRVIGGMKFSISVDWSWEMKTSMEDMLSCYCRAAQGRGFVVKVSSSLCWEDGTDGCQSTEGA